MLLMIEQLYNTYFLNGTPLGLWKYKVIIDAFYMLLNCLYRHICRTKDKPVLSQSKVYFEF